MSHLTTPPGELVVLGLNSAEREANPMATERIVRGLNLSPPLPFADASFDTVLCSVSIDYLTRPVEVLAEAARVLRPDAPVVVTFSNRCFPTKAIPLTRRASSGAADPRDPGPLLGRAVRSGQVRSTLGSIPMELPARRKPVTFTAVGTDHARAG